MGRHYSGDIEGKFAVAVQSSNDADFFGVTGEAPSVLEYYFETSNLPEIMEGIAKCKEALGEYLAKLDDFFNEPRGYNDEQIAKEFGIELSKVKMLLVWYFRLGLGDKILKCVEENGTCSFTAEL